MLNYLQDIVKLIKKGENQERVNERVKSLYELIKKQLNERSPFFARELNTPVKNIERWLKQLKDEGKIEFVGSPKKAGM